MRSPRPSATFLGLRTSRPSRACPEKSVLRGQSFGPCTRQHTQKLSWLPGTARRQWFLPSSRAMLGLGALATGFALTGCGANLQSAATGPVVSTRAIAGIAHGGVYPIQGATVRLMQTQTGTPGGYGSTALTLGTATTDKNGNFTFSSTYTCSSPNEYAYLTVTGGQSANLSSNSTNGAIIEVGVIGTCATLAADYSTINLYLSEASTVAAAYALGNFISVNNNGAPGSGQQIVNIGAPAKNASTAPGCTNTGTPSCTAGGLGHAFQTALNLVDQVNLTGTMPTGAARLTNPSSNVVYSIAPQQMVNTLANILQNCVDSVGGSSYCSTLFTDATPPNGTAPTNTLQVALNMAKYPTNNVAALFSLQSRTPYFTPNLDAAPPALTLSFFYGVLGSQSQFAYPVDVAVDAADNAFMLFGSAAPGPNAATGIIALNPAGAFAGFVANPHYGYPSQMAIDIYGDVFSTNNDGATGALLRASYNSNLTPVAALANASGLTVDPNNNVWVSADNTTGNSLNEYTSGTINSSNGTATPSFTTGNLGPVAGLATDSNADIFGVTNPAGGNSSGIFLRNTGTLATPAYSTGNLYTTAFGAGGGFSIAPAGVAQGNAGYYGNYALAGAYFPLSGQIASAGGVTLANQGFAGGNNLYAGPYATVANSNAPHRSQMDGAGNVFWTDNEANGLLYMYTPSSTPDTQAGTSLSMLPCYAVPDGSSYACATGNSFLRGLAIDSTGNVWMAAASNIGLWIETIGLAAPTWPQISYGQPGVEPQ